jgi:PAS domain S-box-containing protein
MVARQGCGQNLTSIAQPDLAGKNILLLHSYSYEQAAYLIMDPIFVKRFADAGLNLSNVSFEFLDLSKRSESSYWKEVARSLSIKYKGRMIDLIILLHPTALDFLIQECKGLFPGVPVIHVIATTGFIKDDKRPDLERQLENLRQPFIVMPFRVGARATVDAILRLKPDSTRLMVLGGAGPLEERLEETVRADLKHWQGVLDIEYARGLPMDEILRKVAMVPPETAILLTTFYTDGTGRQFRPADAGRMISKAAKAPVFGLFETLLGNDGIVGGIMVNQGQEAERAASMALDVLRGRKLTEPLMIVPTPLVPMFDWQQLKRWGLSGKNLPPESIIVNYPTTLWSQYKTYILGGLALLLMQAIFIVALLAQRRRKRIIEEMLREKNEELDQFFNVSLDMLCIANTDGYFISLNPSFESVLGYTTHELMAKPYLEFVHPDDREATKEAMATLGLQKVLYDLTNRYCCKDGSYRWFEWRAVPFDNLIYAAARDITQKIEASRESEERLRFETLLSKLSTNFVNLPDDQIDSEINQGMRDICEYVGLDFAALWQFMPGVPGFFTMTHYYRPLPGPPFPEKWDAKETFPWCLSGVTAGRVIAVSSDKLPPEASRDQETWQHYEIKSSLVFPLVAGGKAVTGALSFCTISEKCSWTEDLVKRLQLVAEVFANALDRKNSEIALRESEERLSLAASSAGAGLWILDLSTRKFWATAKALELFGLAPDYLLTFDTLLDMVHPEDKRVVVEAVNRATELNEEINIEYRIILPDRGIRWLYSRGQRQASYSDNAERLMGVSLDITERKRAEAAVLEAQSLVTALVESTDDMIWSVDPERFGLLTFNSALSDYFMRGLGLKITEGMSPEDMVIGAFTPMVAEKWRQFYVRALREGPFTEEYRVATGTKVLLLSFNLLKQSGELFGISVFGKDITERKDMEQKIQRAALEWQTTFDNIPDLVMILDTEFRIVRINAAVRSYFGLPKEEIIGAHCYALLHGEEKPGNHCPYMKTLESKGHEEAEFYVDTSKAWFRASTDPVVSDSGETVQVIYTLKDITEQKRAEAEAFAARKELWRTDRLLRMGELTASLAHELNQPLTAILSNAKAAIRFIKSDRIDMNELTEILEDIARDDKRAGDIIRSLRAMLRPEEGEQEVININDLLGETIALFNSEAIIRNIRVEKRFAEFLPLVVANRIQLQQVVINLLMNAAESMMDEYENRKIVVETCIVNGDRAQVAVRDYGTGIDEHELNRIFEPFFTTKHSGLGMGLSLARSIIEGQAGHIWAENNPDGGATFYFELPGFKR